MDWEMFDKLCQIQCTLREIADFFDCSEDTIENRVKEEKGEKFSDYFKKKSGGGIRSLRRKMFELAMAGNTGMCIWLSKQYMGMSDMKRVDSTINTKVENLSNDQILEKIRQIEEEAK